MTGTLDNVYDEVLKYVRGILGWNELQVNKRTANLHFLREFLRDRRINLQERNRLLNKAVTYIVDNHHINGIKKHWGWLDDQGEPMPARSDDRIALIEKLVRDLEDALSAR